MTRICEVCGRIENAEHTGHPYDILDVCLDCSEHAIHQAHEWES